MALVTLDLPDDVFADLCLTPEEFVEDLRLAAAIYWYQRSEVSLRRAAQIAGLERTGFLEALARHRVDVFDVDVAQLRRELEGG
ncbi:UPF0175 family protein [Anthocerotibacter panamensis]|uniref:UPF0175 family protein n=1 Tax=Anthocerotibacter panamensis TaxID=2857077 RepID=UPI001C402EA8|nr:UPF0175 family protein [Anthocerotibacter panamensis]